MGRLATNVLEAAIKAIGVGTGAAIGIGGANEASKNTTQTNTDAKDKSVAKTETTTKEKKACEKCPPDCGELVLRDTAGWKPWTIAYQQRIGGMPPAPIGYVHEWKFSGIDFDGFQSSSCVLKEAKAKYDYFFNDLGRIKEWWSGDADLIEQAVKQSNAVRPIWEKTKLNWYFMEPKSYRYFSKIFDDLQLAIETKFQP
jgi:hypothetical protein